MHRRTFLAAGTGFAGLAGLAGCLSQSGQTGSETVSSSSDGYPSTDTNQATERKVDTESFPTVDRDGVAVPLAPVDVAHYWHQGREARFADARGETQYENSHILGAVLSPANESGTNGPVAAWPKDDRIMCYCGCPHHLSSIRAASLLSNGYKEVYVIDEGVWEWQDRGYPMTGANVESRPPLRLVQGRVAPRFAGETAWAYHDPTGQREATGINNDGSFELELKFVDVTTDSPVRVQTPEYTLEQPLEKLTKGVLTS